MRRVKLNDLISKFNYLIKKNNVDLLTVLLIAAIAFSVPCFIKCYVWLPNSIFSTICSA